MAAPIDVTAPSLEQQAYIVALELQKQELAVPAENRPNRTQIEFVTEANTVSLSISLDTTFSVTNGEAVFTAKPYLI